MIASTIRSRVCSFETRVIANRELCREHVAIDVTASGFPASEPGQFVQLLCHEDHEFEASLRDWNENLPPKLAAASWGDRDAYLRRPFSLADHWVATDGLTHLTVISRAVGPGTRWLDRLQVGQTLNVTGPLGKPFRIPADPNPLLLIGGGVGIPPLLYLARRLQQLGHLDVTCIFGSTSGDLFPVPRLDEPLSSGTATACLALPGNALYPSIVTTDDGSLGLRGRVTDALDHWFNLRGPDAARAATLFACGPDAMLKAVAAAAAKSGAACQLCIERHMGCGIGTCLSCVVRVRSERHPAGWRWALTCTEGPIFTPDELYEG